MRSIAIIPARYASTRFPGKPLALLSGKPMLQHVFENVKRSGLFSEILIATDDSRIEKAAQNWGAAVVMTKSEHQTGTERVAEVAEKTGDNYDLIINIQGDEPFISREPLSKLLSIFESPNAR